MGLSVVLGIVKGHGGAITIESEPKKGTTFNVFLPQIEKSVIVETESSEVLPFGKERILFVDDEEVLVKMGKQMLERLGYDVTVKTSSLDALKDFLACPDDFDLVITDVNMPNMTGTELARKITDIRRDLPIILCTGYNELVTMEELKAMGIQEIMLKPICLRDLAGNMRKLLDKG